MTPDQYVTSWVGQLSAAYWVLHECMPVLLSAAACRIVTLLFVPRSR